jgi:hypothetical protein
MLAFISTPAGIFLAITWAGIEAPTFHGHW